MPLSEHEERMLAEIERQLEEEDPGLMDRARRAVVSDSTRRLRFAAAGFVLGLVLLLGLTFHLALGLVGFALMLVSVVAGAGALVERGSSAARRLRDRLDETFDAGRSDGDL